MERQSGDPGSNLSFFRALTALRQYEPALFAGSYGSVDAGADEVFAYVRRAEMGDDFLIVLNCGDESHKLDLSDVASHARVALSTEMSRNGNVNLARLTIAPTRALRCGLCKIDPAIRWGPEEPNLQPLM